MNVFKKILLKVEGVQKTIFFGMPDTENELKEMYKLRYRVYVEKQKYIPVTDQQNGSEVDEYDRNNFCHYFIARIDDRIIGSTRMIRHSPLPIEKDYFAFETPLKVRDIPKDKMVEIGRLISTKYSKDVYLPRHLVLLGLLSSMIEFGIQKGYMGGYGAIKEKGKKALQALNVPIHDIENAKIIYDPETSHDPLSNFFGDSTNPVHPIYYVGEELQKYLDNILNNKFMFKRIDKDTFLFKNMFLMKMWHTLNNLFR